MSFINYHLKMEEEISLIMNSDRKPGLLLHACCAPCSSYVIELLHKFFNITVYFYNPNIYPEDEHNRRFSELEHFLKSAGYSETVGILYENYSPMDFAACARGFEDESEGGQRCFNCYDLRLSKTAEKAKASGFDYFTTTLTISPHKNAQVINLTGEKLAELYEVKFLYSDFKKKEGYKRSVELSSGFGLYRQDYCGCKFSFKKKITE